MNEGFEGLRKEMKEGFDGIRQILLGWSGGLAIALILYFVTS